LSFECTQTVGNFVESFQRTETDVCGRQATPTSDVHNCMTELPQGSRDKIHFVGLAYLVAGLCINVIDA